MKNKLSEAVSLKPASKAAKMERHVSAHDNTNAALMSAGIDTVRTFLLEQKEVSPELYLVSDLQLKYNDYVTSNLPENAASSSNVLSDYITKSSERLAEAIPGLRRLIFGKTSYVCFDSRIVASLAATIDAECE